MHLLDTNTVSYAMRGRPPRVAERMAQRPQLRMAVSVITEAELLYGATRRVASPGLRAAVEAFLFQVEVVDWDRAAAHICGPLRAQLELDRTPLDDIDTLIAAHALALNAVLVTSDRAFARVPGLRTEDWTV
ncbi:MAG: type II toxin-antitoxin system VapC family toxin [Terriglobales bacterium]